MTPGELIFLATGLAMDAFAVSVCKGLAMSRAGWRQAWIPGLWFGGAQGLAPLLGWLLGARFAGPIAAVDHWAAFLLLAALGGNMLWEARKGPSAADPSLRWRTMLAMAAATSVDALAVGVTFSFLEVPVLPAAGLIAGVTGLLSAAGVRLGALSGARLQRGAQALGGAVLLLVGLRILLEHTGRHLF